MVKLRVDEQIELKQLQLRDADEVYELTAANRDFLAAWMSWVEGIHSKEDAVTFISTELHKHAAGRGLSLGIRVEGQLAGMVGFNSIDIYHNRGDIGYWLAEPYGGRGIMTRSCMRLIDYAFTELELHRIEIRAAVDNWRSRLIAERLGFVQEGIVREVERIRNRYVNHVIYGMLAQEWKGRFRT